MTKGALFDIAPSNETVTLRGVAVPVKGLGLSDLVGLIKRFPELQVLLGGGGATLEASSLLAKVPTAVYAAIACGVGHPNDEDAERHIASMSFGDQLKLFEPVLKGTLGEDGARPLLARLNATFEQFGGKTSSRAVTSPKR